MKIQKGDAGYLRRRKRLLILEAVVSFGLVAALVIAGYVTTKTKLNLLTVVAVLGCLPASRILVNLIMVMPHDSIDEATELEISAVTEELTVAYDLVITSEKKAMPVAAVAIYNNTICGYVPVKKVDVDYAAKHIKSIMKQNQFDKAEDYVNRLAKTNKGAKKFLRLAAKNDRRSLFMEQGLYGYQPDTIEELVEEYLTSPYLFVTTPYFCQWAYQYLRAQTAAKKKKPEPEK